MFYLILFNFVDYYGIVCVLCDNVMFYLILFTVCVAAEDLDMDKYFICESEVCIMPLLRGTKKCTNCGHTQRGIARLDLSRMDLAGSAQADVGQEAPGTEDLVSGPVDEGFDPQQAPVQDFKRLEGKLMPGYEEVMGKHGLTEIMETKKGRPWRFQTLRRGRVLWGKWETSYKSGKWVMLQMRVLGPPGGKIHDLQIPKGNMCCEILEIRTSAGVSSKYNFVGLHTRTLAGHFNGSPQVGGKQFVDRVNVDILSKAFTPNRKKTIASQRLLMYFDCSRYVSCHRECEFWGTEPAEWEFLGPHPKLKDFITDQEPLSEDGEDPHHCIFPPWVKAPMDQVFACFACRHFRITNLSWCVVVYRKKLI